MAFPQHYHKHYKPQSSALETFGNKIRNVAEIAGTMKTAYDTGKFLYNTFQAVSPLIAAAII